MGSIMACLSRLVKSVTSFAQSMPTQMKNLMPEWENLKLLSWY